MNNELLLDVVDLEVYYGGIHALHTVSLHVNKGEIVSIVGANGAGKSTLMRTIAGDKERKSGDVIFNGQSMPQVSSKVVSKGISLVPEGRRVFPKLSVYDNLMLGAFVRNDKAAIREDMEEIFSLFPILHERQNQYSGTLSGGEQQMLAVGRAMMSRPTLLCLDEPSLGLAPIIIDELFEKIEQINTERGQTILLVEQNAYLALEMAHRAYVLDTGRILTEGVGSEMLNDPFIQKTYLGVES